MQISFARPLDLAWLRMTTLLFKPFDLTRWLVLGFTAWLAQLGESGLGGASAQLRFSDSLDSFDFRGLVDHASVTVRDFLEGGWAAAWIGLILITGVIVWLALLWISSRGRFILLDNLVHGRARVVAPWKKFAEQGDSLFLWHVVYSLVAVVVAAALTSGGFLAWASLAALSPPLVIALPLAFLAGSVVLLVILAAIFIEFFLTAFIVPVMYRDRVTATAAWSRWLPLFREHPTAFVLFGLLYGGIVMVGAILYLLAGIFTCCAGWLLMALPYVGTVITLPLPVFCGYLNLEFLGQFGETFRILAPVGSGQLQGDGTMIGPEDLGQDAGSDEPGPQGG